MCTLIEKRRAATCPLVEERRAATYPLVDERRAPKYSLVEERRAATYLLVEERRAATYPLVEERRVATYPLVEERRAATYPLVEERRAPTYPVVEERRAATRLETPIRAGNRPTRERVAPRMTTIGFIGAGKIGSTLARAAIDHGYDVVLSNSRGPDTLTSLVDELGPRARAATGEHAAAAGDLVVVTIPLREIGSVPVEPLAGKVVIDTNNYYPQRDGVIAALEDESTTTAELLQSHLPESHVVKAFNAIPYREILAHARPSGTENRRALPIAGDDDAAKADVSAFIDAIGFDVVDLGPLAEGWRVQRDTPAYLPDLNVEQMRAAAASAKRYRDM